MRGRDECSEGAGHRLPVVGNQNPSFGSGEGEYLGVTQAAKLPADCRAEINRGLAAENALHDVVVKVSVGQESDLHFRVAGACWRASSSFR